MSKEDHGTNRRRGPRVAPPGLMQCEEFRVLQGAGADSDLIAGYARLRERSPRRGPTS
jgi:hypothetical protein